MSVRGRPIEGSFRYRHPVEVRFGDTDALGHVNNAVYLTYFEAARAGYYAAVAGRPFGTGPDAAHHTFVIADARVAYRQPAFFGEPLVVEARVPWASRSSFGLQYRVVSEGGPLAPARRASRSTCWHSSRRSRGPPSRRSPEGRSGRSLCLAISGRPPS